MAKKTFNEDVLNTIDTEIDYYLQDHEDKETERINFIVSNRLLNIRSTFKPKKDENNKGICDK